MPNYRSGGDWVVAAEGDVILAVTGDSAVADAVALWPLLAAADVTAPVLERLTSRGLAATPWFVLVAPAGSGALRVFVRGDHAVTVSGRAGDVAVSGRDASTWQERTVPEATGFRFGDGASVGDLLPLTSGIVRASHVESAEAEPDGETIVRSVEDTVVVQRTAPPAAAPVAPVPVPVPVAPAQDVGEETIAAVEDADESPAEDSVDSVSTSIELPAFITGGAAPASDDREGDHDGLTIMGADVRRLLDASRSTAPPAPPASAVPVAPVVRLRLPSGAREIIENDVIIGRAPSVSKVSGARIPRLVTVGADDPDISRNHVQVSLEGDTVVVTDLDSRNGTVVAYPGKAPQKLRAGESTTVLVGTVIDLGGGITLEVVSD
ncbi:MAG: FHA domain-containing protein [Leifsonia sp.]